MKKKRRQKRTDPRFLRTLAAHNNRGDVTFNPSKGMDKGVVASIMKVLFGRRTRDK